MADEKLSPIQLYAVGALAAGAFPTASEQCIGNHSEDSVTIFNKLWEYWETDISELDKGVSHSDGGLYLSEDCDSDAIKIRVSFFYTGTTVYDDIRTEEEVIQKRELKQIPATEKIARAEAKEQFPIKPPPRKLRSLNLPIMLEIMNKLQGGDGELSMCLDDNIIMKSEWASKYWIDKIYSLYSQKFKIDVRNLLRQRDWEDYEYKYFEDLRNSDLITTGEAVSQITDFEKSTINTAEFKNGTWNYGTDNVNSAAWMFCLKNRYSYTNAPEWSPKGASIVFSRTGDDNEAQYEFSNLARQQLVVNRGLLENPNEDKWSQWRNAIEANRNPKGREEKATAARGVANMITELRGIQAKDQYEEKLLGYLLESNYPRKCWLTGYPIFDYDTYFANGMGKQEAEHVLPLGMAKTLLAIVTKPAFNNALQDPFTTTELEHAQGAVLDANALWMGRGFAGRAPGALRKIKDALNTKIDADGVGVVRRELERHTAPLGIDNQDAFNLLLREKIAAGLKPSTKLGNQIKTNVPFISLFDNQYLIDLEVCSKFLLITGLCMFEFNYKDILLFGNSDNIVFNQALNNFKPPVLDIADLNEVERVIYKAAVANGGDGAKYAYDSYKFAYRDFKNKGEKPTQVIIDTITKNWTKKKLPREMTVNVEIPWLINHPVRKGLIEAKIRRENRSIFFEPQ